MAFDFKKEFKEFYLPATKEKVVSLCLINRNLGASHIADNA